MTLDELLQQIGIGDASERLDPSDERCSADENHRALFIKSRSGPLAKYIEASRRISPHPSVSEEG